MNSEELMILEILEENSGISLKQLAVLLYMRKLGLSDLKWCYTVELVDPAHFHYLHVRKLLENMEIKGYIIREEREHSSRRRVIFHRNSKNQYSKDIYTEP